MNPDPALLLDPVFFAPTRVWRCYLGGRLLDEFTGTPAGCDANFPEDWLASVTRADNGAQQQSPDEGLSRLRDADLAFADLLRTCPEAAFGPDHSGGLGLLCKFLDSAIRLPIQCHPDRPFARRYYQSEHGKTESWLILATREINGEAPYLLLGFKPGIREEQFRRAVLAQDVAAMCDCLHRVTPRPGEVYFIPGRLPHAIGPGLMLLEVQEPTDLVIQPERRIGAITLSDVQMWGGLDIDTAFSCFDYRGEPLAELLARLRLQPELRQEWPGARLESLIGPRHTDCFGVDRLTLTGELDLSFDAPWYLGIVTAGSGTVTGTGERPLCRGDRFFVSHRVDRLRYRANATEPLELHLVRSGLKP